MQYSIRNIFGAVAFQAQAMGDGYPVMDIVHLIPLYCPKGDIEYMICHIYILRKVRSKTLLKYPRVTNYMPKYLPVTQPFWYQSLDCFVKSPFHIETWIIDNRRGSSVPETTKDAD